MQFYYRARTDEGEERNGALEAPTRLAALKALAERGWHVDYCGVRPPREPEEGAEYANSGVRLFWPLMIIRPYPGHMANFYHQIASLLGSGVTAHEAVSALSERAPTAALRAAMAEIAPRLAAGASLSEELARYPQLFPPQDLGLLRAADRSGDWEGLCRELEDYYTQLTKGLLWFLVARVYYTALLLFVILVPFFPWVISRGFRWYGHFLLTRLLPVIMGLFFAWIVLRVLAGLQMTRPLRDRLVLLVPLARGQELRAAGLRFLRALGSLLHAGVEVPEAMEIAADATGNMRLAAQARRAAEELRAGRPVEQIANNLPFLTRDQKSILATAFQAGRLEEGFRRLTADAREQTARKIWGVRLASMALVSGIMTVLAAAAIIVGWLNLYAAAADRAGVGDVWRDLWK